MMKLMYKGKSVHNSCTGVNFHARMYWMHTDFPLADVRARTLYPAAMLRVNA